MPFIVTRPAEPLTALDWPANSGVEANTVRLDFMGGVLPQFAPFTFIWQKYPHAQEDGYKTTFFHCDVQDLFSSDQRYYGAHEYPEDFGGGPTFNWEVSAQGGDHIVDDNAHSTVVVQEAWYQQACVVSVVNTNEIEIKFYWNIAAGFDRVITFTTTSDYMDKTPANPGLVIGDAPWSKGNEMLHGYLRGLQMYEAALNTTQIGALVAEDYDADVLTVASGLSLSPFYLKMNPTHTNVADASGNGNDPSWFNSNRPGTVTL